MCCQFGLFKYKYPVYSIKSKGNDPDFHHILRLSDSKPLYSTSIIQFESICHALHTLPHQHRTAGTVTNIWECVLTQHFIDSICTIVLYCWFLLFVVSSKQTSIMKPILCGYESLDLTRLCRHSWIFCWTLNCALDYIAKRKLTLIRWIVMRIISHHANYDCNLCWWYGLYW